jgi:TP901 family phage tail tape measure protein
MHAARNTVTPGTLTERNAVQSALGMLGFEENQIFNMTEPILKFATAINEDPSKAAHLARAAMRAFGLVSWQITHVISVMAAGITKSALSFSYLQNALLFVAPVAIIVKLTIERTVALLGTYADSGLDASSAAYGTGT